MDRDSISSERIRNKVTTKKDSKFHSRRKKKKETKKRERESKKKIQIPGAVMNSVTKKLKIDRTFPLTCVPIRG